MGTNVIYVYLRTTTLNVVRAFFLIHHRKYKFTLLENEFFHFVDAVLEDVPDELYCLAFVVKEDDKTSNCSKDAALNKTAGGL